jgi:hypothetical protein
MNGELSKRKNRWPTRGPAWADNGMSIALEIRNQENAFIDEGVCEWRQTL